MKTAKNNNNPIKQWPKITEGALVGIHISSIPLAISPGIPALLACAGGAGPAAWRAASALANLAEWQELVPELREAQGPRGGKGGKILLRCGKNQKKKRKNG